MNSVSLVTPNTSKHSFTKGIRGRLFVGFGVIALILALTMILVLYKITTSENSAMKVIDVDLPTHDNFYDLTLTVYSTELALSNWVVTSNPIYKNSFDRDWKLIEGKISSLDAYSENWDNTIYMTKWNEIKVILDHLRSAQLKLITSTSPSPSSLTTDVTPLFTSFLTIVDGPLNESGERIGGLFDQQYHILKNGSRDIIINLKDIRIIEYILLIVTTLALIIVAMYTTRGMIRYVNTFRQHSANIASGDLRNRIEVISQDELGQLGNDLNTMTDSLSDITKEITEACHNMVTTIEEVRRAVDIQTSGATEQASSINQITSSLEEIEKSSSQTIEKAKALGEVAERTRDKGQLGLKSVENSVTGMKSVRDKVQTIAQTILELSTQTQQVGEITSVVNTLAQQFAGLR